MDYAHYSEFGQTGVWWFKAKDELVKSFFSKDDTLLDVGANVAEGFYDFKETIVLDSDLKSLKAVKVRSKVNADAARLPLRDGSIKNILASEVLEHTRDDKLAVSELHRVLSSGGKLVVTVPAFEFLYSPHDELLGHKRRYTKKRIRKLLEGFKIKRNTYWNFFLSAPAMALKLAKKAVGRRTYDAGTRYAPLNSIFLSILRIENFLIKKGVNLPFGLTLVVEAERP